MKKGYLIILILLTMLTVCSLALNGVVIVGLLRAQRIALDAQQTALDAVSDARTIVTGISDGTFSYTLTVEQEIPIATTIPFNEEVSVPIHTTIPISTTVVIPINAGLLGTFSIDVPIRAIIPVDLEFTVPISQSVDIATTVPLDVDVPINIPLAETPLIDYMDEVDAALARFGEALERLEGKLTNPFNSDEE
ncbi:MAG: hypothetical protein B6I35_07570 [Anaerolineaceae bacterium 4572_32.2]|nr:MAG: hypothetical protein B6I35_07570 [Anaerolineaceae bacterium 4572_32.2]HEY72773.1 hypothetical protein [Thermoflexia bacterium]